MTSLDHRSGAEILAEACPFGSYGPENTLRAAELAAEAIRYLNHATSWDAAQALPDPGACDSLVGHLQTLTSRLPQLLRQVATVTNRQAADPRLEVDNACTDRDAADTATRAAECLADAAGSVGPLTSRLSEANTDLSRLYLSTPASSTDADQADLTDGW